MKTLAQQMAVYNAYHLNPRNKRTHFIGVPLIVIALLSPLSWVRIETTGLAITGAVLFVAIVAIWYVLLDVSLGLLTIAAVLPMLGIAHLIALQGRTTGWVAFAIAFVGGWVFQLVGHAIEGRRPALVDNFLQIFVAPVFLVAEALFHFGLRGELKHEVDSLTVMPSTRNAQAEASPAAR
jgi:uncharacterized membrane protein YGL010W